MSAHNFINEAHNFCTCLTQNELSVFCRLTSLCCVEPRTSAVKITLPAATTRAPAANNGYLLPAPRLRQAADVDRRDRQTDTQPLH